MQWWFLGYMDGHSSHSPWLNHGCKIECLQADPSELADSCLSPPISNRSNEVENCGKILNLPLTPRSHMECMQTSTAANCKPNLIACKLPPSPFNREHLFTPSSVLNTPKQTWPHHSTKIPRHPLQSIWISSFHSHQWGVLIIHSWTTFPCSSLLPTTNHYLWKTSTNWWATYGDTNTKFFHLKTLQHRNQARITTLKYFTGLWVSEETLKTHIKVAFTTLFTSSFLHPASKFTLVRNYHWSCPFLEQYQWLSSIPLPEGISRNAFSLPPLKALGSDGYHAICFHWNWNILGPSIIHVIQEIFETASILED